jgi:hypothetical protein
MLDAHQTAGVLRGLVAAEELKRAFLRAALAVESFGEVAAPVFRRLRRRRGRQWRLGGIRESR